MAPDNEPTAEELALVMHEARDEAMRKHAIADASRSASPRRQRSKKAPSSSLTARRRELLRGEASAAGHRSGTWVGKDHGHRAGSPARVVRRLRVHQTRQHRAGCVRQIAIHMSLGMKCYARTLTVVFISRPVSFSCADMWRMPSTLQSKTTSTRTAPLGPRRMPEKENSPRSSFFFASLWSPW